VRGRQHCLVVNFDFKAILELLGFQHGQNNSKRERRGIAR